jgi:hypothetical protein
MPTVPIDGRPQFSMAHVVVANAQLGRPPFAGVERVGPDLWRRTRRCLGPVIALARRCWRRLSVGTAEGPWRHGGEEKSRAVSGSPALFLHLQ